MGLCGKQTDVLRELANVSVIFEMSWSSGEVPEVGKKSNIFPVSNKYREEDPEAVG